MKFTEKQWEEIRNMTPEERRNVFVAYMIVCLVQGCFIGLILYIVLSKIQ